MREIYLAHSAKGGFAAQSYQAHVTAVTNNAARYAANAEKYSKKFSGELERIVRNAAALHDLGKLLEENQSVLCASDKDHAHLPINHVDAGCAELLSEGAAYSALAVYSHHRGLPDISDERSRGVLMLRDNKADVRKVVDNSLSELLLTHKTLCPNEITKPELRVDGNPMFLRMALSCLADADHSDTAGVYGDVVDEHNIPQLRAKERLDALDRYVNSLGGNDDRSKLRTEMYNVCRNASADTPFSVCDSPVGSGKTTAVMANLLRQAIENNSRRIFVILPFTNIIQQSVNVYRKALVLPGENPEDVVAELHFRADFQSEDSRRLTSLWRAPIIVTTAVAFFGTLSSSKPSALRRLHELPGSVILLDEAHCTLPLKLLPLAWQWMNIFAEDWGCRWVLASGSLVRFWELKSLHSLKLPYPEIAELTDSELHKKLADYEAGRVTFCAMQNALSRNELIKTVQESAGPRILIVNTVQSAAVIAEDICNQYGRQCVEHLSTALNPHDRDAVVQRIMNRLKDKNDTNWTLVATSCVEAGVDFSFRTGFRENSSLLSLLQAAGRVNRHGEYGTAEMWSFSFIDDKMLTKNKGLKCSALVLERYLKNGMEIKPELSTKSLEDEITVEGGVTLRQIKHFTDLEKDMSFSSLDKEFEPIENDTVIAVTDDRIADEIAHGGGNPHKIQLYSVNIRRSLISKYGLSEILPEVYRWTLGYDDFLGYMRGVLDRRIFETGFLNV